MLKLKLIAKKIVKKKIVKKIVKKKKKKIRVIRMGVGLSPSLTSLRSVVASNNF